MAQLKSLLVSGPTRLIGDSFANKIELTSISAPKTSGGTEYSLGTNGQILKSNGSSVYWTSLGGAAGYGVTDSTSASAIGTGTSLPTERDIYYGLPIINNSHSYNSNTTIYAPTAGGTAGYVLIGAGTTTAPTWSQTLAVANGGTGATTAAGARTNLGLGTMATETASNYILKSTLSGAFDIMYSSAANTPTRLAANTTSTKKFLRMTGTGSAGTAPAWDTVTKTDVGLSNVENTKLSTWVGSSNITTIGTLSSGTVPWARLSNIPSASTSVAGIIQIGTGATNAAAGNHTHSTSLATDTGTATVTLAHNTTYKLTAGGTSVIFKMPSDNNTDTKVTQGTTTTESWRKILLNGGSSTVYSAWDTAVGDDVTDIAYRTFGVAVQPSTNTLKATNLEADKTVKVGTFTIGGNTDELTKTISSSSTIYVDRTNASVIFKYNGTNKIRIDTNNYLRPETDNTLQLGDSSYRWNKIYGTTIYGTLSGNATTATTANFVGKGTHTAAVTANEFTPTVGTLTIVGNVSNTTMAHTNNANAEIIIKAHPTSETNYYEGRLGFSSNGKLYYMPINNTTWKQIAYTSSDITGNAATATTATNANNVKQNNQIGDNDYRLLLSGNANDTPETTVVNKSTNLKFNPSTKILKVGGSVEATGNLTVIGNTNLNNETYADSLTAGSLLVTGNSNFTQIPTAPTPANSSNDTSIATTAFVKNSISSLSNAMHFIGKATVAITDGSTTDPAISGYSTKVAGDVVIDKDTSYEYVWTKDGKWERLGPDGSYSLSTHTHGNITNDGKITSTTTIANGDKLVIVDVDSTAGSKLTGSSITFDGSTETNCLTQKGTWKPFNNYSHPTGDGNLHVPATGTSNNGKFLKAGSTAGSLSWGTAVTSITPGNGLLNGTGTSAITTSGTLNINYGTSAASAVSTTAAAGSANTVSRSDHVHSISVVNNNINLSRNTETTIATIAGTAIKIKLPASDNTDTKVNVIKRGTTKSYILGDTTAPPDSAAAHTAVAESYIYMTSTAGQMSAKSYSFNDGASTPTEKAQMIYNTTTGCLEIIVA